MPEETSIPPPDTGDARADQVDDTGAGSPAVRAVRTIGPSGGIERPMIALAVAALVLLLTVGIAWMARPTASASGVGKPLVALTKSDWLLLPASERERTVDRALRTQCNGANIDAQARLVTRLIDAAYGYGSTDTPVKQVIDYLDTAPLTCWGSIGGTK